MILLWFFVGLALGCVYVWLQWLQVKNITPDAVAARRNFSLLYALRLTLFTVVTAIALHSGVVFGLVMFAGFWTSRSLFLILIGSGRVRLSVRRN